MRRKNDRSQTMIRGIMVAAAVLIIVLIGILFFRRTAPLPPPEPPPVTRPEPLAQTSEPSPPPEQKVANIIQFREDNEDFRELMQRRKAEYGLDKGVDMIVKEDETLHIGENKVSMKEILDKIRLEKGSITEEDLGSPAVLRSKQEKLERLYAELSDSEKKFREMERELIQESGKDPETSLPEKLRKHGELGRIADDYRNYQQILRDIETQQQILSSEDIRQQVQNEIGKLKQKQSAIERELGKLSGIPLSPEITDEERLHLQEALEKSEKRFQELEEALSVSELTVSDENVREMIRERAGLRNMIAGYETYKDILRSIEKSEKLLEKNDEDIRQELHQHMVMLRIRRDDLEDSLMKKLLPDEAPEVYGIYVVRTGDNVWNIHFSFLREYFENRKIRIARSADEPIMPGLSSGVGRILKFSEKMVYIYNLREKKLEPDLNIIHPLSKIVVFNMGQAFELLRQVDYANIHQVRFDGENLWIPASE